MEQQFAGWRKKFFVIWIGQGISTLTSSIVQMAIIWYITGKTKSAAVLSFATLAGFLPQAVLGMFIGVLIDQHDRKKIMICSDLVMSSACVALAVSGIWGDIPIWLIFIVLFIRSIGNAFYAPSLQAIMPSILPKDQLTKYAGYSQSFESASMIASPAIAAVLYSMFPLKAILMLDVLGAFFAVGTLAAVDIPEIFREDKEKTNLLAEVKEGYNVMRSVPGMRELLVIGALYAVIYFPIGTLYPLITMSYFNGSVSESGLVETVFKGNRRVHRYIWSRYPDNRPAASTRILYLCLPVIFHGNLCPLLFWGTDIHLSDQNSGGIPGQGAVIVRQYQHGGNAAGACSVRSPGRSAGNRELVSDIRRGNTGDSGVCLNSSCFAALYGRMIPAKYVSGRQSMIQLPGPG